MEGLTRGAVIAGYRIEEVIGKGGMGVIYRAYQIALDREVALKVISPELADDPDFQARFQRESRIAASIKHPNVVTIYDAQEADGVLFLAMDLVEGTDLRVLLSEQ